MRGTSSPGSRSTSVVASTPWIPLAASYTFLSLPRTITRVGPLPWMAPPAPLPVAYDTLTAALDTLEAASPERVGATAVRAMWRLVAVLGFEPSLTACVRDAAAIESAGDAPVWFSVADGGVLCPRCVQAPSPPPQPPSRLPPQAYRDLLALNDPSGEPPALDPPHAAAHRRLAARF